ncbi:hypothetical protein DFR30_1257 [Thiogranum longum]|uniref:Uncharacterized protein n=1 Tax=Thiogranum longum TaxID=1537524 RepID=A0A4R1H9M0_9GAMM|nr:hypothetical protein [Thiogranum longum]TCK17998.1 hypothetical protein DFR30_1257 [Thiogranum longum]
MKSVFRTLLNVLLVVSLATTPVAVALATVQAGSQLSVISGDSMAPCPHAMQERAPAVSQKASPEKVSCTCRVDDCSSMDSDSCHHFTAFSLIALLTGAVKFPAMGKEHMKAVLQDRHTGLNITPESPPPIV